MSIFQNQISRLRVFHGRQAMPDFWNLTLSGARPGQGQREEVGNFQMSLLGHFTPPSTPVVDRRLGYAVPPSKVAGLRAGLCLLQHPDDLLFRKPLALHLVRPRLGRTLIATGGNYPWQVTGPKSSHRSNPASH